MSKYNSFGLFAAKRRAKLKAEQDVKEKKTSNKRQPKEPNLDWEPMSLKKIKLPKYPINWNDISTNTHAENMKEGLKHEKFKLLCMPPGTGKTAVTVATVGKMQEETGNKIPIIITAPAKVVQGLGWHNTILSWNTNHPENTIEPVLITSVDKMRAALEHPPTFRKILKALGTNGLVIMDEVQKYKNPTGKRAKTMQKLIAYKRIGLSATPVTNDVVMDSASYLIMGGYFRNKTHFMEETNLNEWVDERTQQLKIYNKDGTINRVKWPFYEVLLNIWSQILHKPDIDLELYDMPNVKCHIIQLPFDEQLNADMRSLVHAYKNRMFDSFTDFFMEYVDRLHNDKLRINKLKELVQQPGVKQPLIFYKNTAVLEIIQRALEDLGMEYQIVNGNHSFADIDLDSTNPLLVQYQSGAEGIEMKNSNTTIYFQNQTSYDVLKQARGRNVRRGMKDENGNDIVIHQYNIIADDVIDQDLFNRVMNREEISEAMLEEIVNLALDGN